MSFLDCSGMYSAHADRIPHYPPASLTALWRSKTPEHATRVLKYYLQRAVMDIEIVDAAEIITKNA